MSEHDPIAVVLVDYRVIDGWHVLISDQVRGLYVANPDKRLAHEAIATMIERLLAENENVDVAVKPARSLAAFLGRRSERAQSVQIEAGTPQPFMVTARQLGADQ